MDACSLIIPVHNRAALTNQCLTTLLAEPRTSLDVEIIVVDDASTDGTPQLLAGYGDRITIIRHDVNTGFAGACNDGAAAASGEYLVFLNNDTIPQPGWLEALVEYAKAHRKAAVVGSKMLFPDDTIQHAGVVICLDGNPRHIYAGFPAKHQAVNKSRPFQIVTAGCALVRRDIFLALGCFDSAFRNGYEDVDFCLRVGKLGFEIHYCHESILYHLEKVTRNVHSSQAAHNFALYRARWANQVRSDEFTYYIEDELLSIDYDDLYPSRWHVAPDLALIDGDVRDRLTDRLLTARAQQVFDLLRASIDLHVRASEAELLSSAGRPNGSRPSLGQSTSRATLHPHTLLQGEIHWLSHSPTDRIISVVIPTKNGASKLPDLLQRLLDQHLDDRLEIVAIDSSSSDDTVDVLRESRATVLSVEPLSFNHGLTRNLAAEHAQGDILVFINQNTLPGNEDWLRHLLTPFEGDPLLAGACSRVLPRVDADILTAREVLLNPNASPDPYTRAIDDRQKYEALSHHELRLFLNFHTLSAAIRADVFQKFPFRQVLMGEDLVWAKDVLEAGLKIAHAPDSIVFHSHTYTFTELLQRNFDDGFVNRSSVGRRLADKEVMPLIASLVRQDWHYLESDRGLDGSDLDHWRLSAALRRSAQIIGQWMGVNSDAETGDLTPLLSLTERIKAGIETESVNAWRK